MLNARYVSLSGLDSNDGSILSPKRTIKAAIESLPTVDNDNIRHYGSIFVDNGTYDEIPPIYTDNHIRIVGTNTSASFGTRVRRNGIGNLFEPSPLSPSAFSHHLKLEHVTLDGNSSVYTETASLLIIKRGGFNTYLHDVNFRNSTGPGIELIGSGLNFSINQATFSDCLGGAIKLNLDAGDLGLMDIDNLQIDNCGSSPILIEDTKTTGNSLHTRFVSLRNIKFESQGVHQHCIHIKLNGNSPLAFNISNVWARNFPKGLADNLIYEELGGGTARYVIHNCATDDQFNRCLWIPRLNVFVFPPYLSQILA